MNTNAPFPPSRRARGNGGFTMVELLVVILVIGILGALSFPVFAKITRLAEEIVSLSNLKQIVTATMRWSMDNSDKLPSPKYTGSEPELPIYWDLNTDGETGLWLNGVIFAAIYVEDPQDAKDGDGNAKAPSVGGASNLASSGKHLVGTVFESRVSVKRNPDIKDWYRHSFAMNANLMYDELAVLRGQSQPWYSEKLTSKFEPVAAMLFIDCSATNVVMASDISLIQDTAKTRYDGNRIIAAFVDGHVAKMHPNQIPIGDPVSNRESSLFWRGIMPRR